MSERTLEEIIKDINALPDDAEVVDGGVNNPRPITGKDLKCLAATYDNTIYDEKDPTWKREAEDRQLKTCPQDRK